MGKGAGGTSATPNSIRRVRARAPADCGSMSGWTHACLILVVFFLQMISNDDAMVRLGYEYGYIPRPSDLREGGDHDTYRRKRNA